MRSYDCYQSARPATRVTCVMAAAVIICGCAGPTTIYSWSGYQSAVHESLKDPDGDSLRQVAAMEAGLHEAASSDKPLPPGYRAHLGMLYLKSGDGDKALQMLNAEKAAFPESVQFMDFLLKKAATAEPRALEEAQQ